MLNSTDQVLTIGYQLTALLMHNQLASHQLRMRGIRGNMLLSLFDIQIVTR